MAQVAAATAATTAARSDTAAPWDLATVCAHLEAGTPAHLVDNRRVLAVTPDATRSAPMPMLIQAVQQVIGSRAAQLDYMVALGTHPVMSDAEILRLYGLSAQQRERDFGGFAVHEPPLGPARNPGQDRALRSTGDRRDHRWAVRGGDRRHHQSRHLRL